MAQVPASRTDSEGRLARSVELDVELDVAIESIHPGWGGVGSTSGGPPVPSFAAPRGVRPDARVTSFRAEPIEAKSRPDSRTTGLRRDQHTVSAADGVKHTRRRQADVVVPVWALSLRAYIVGPLFLRDSCLCPKKTDCQPSAAHSGPLEANRAHRTHTHTRSSEVSQQRGQHTARHPLLARCLARPPPVLTGSVAVGRLSELGPPRRRPAAVDPPAAEFVHR